MNLALQWTGIVVILLAGGAYLTAGTQSLLFVGVGFLLILLGGHRELTTRADAEEADHR